MAEGREKRKGTEGGEKELGGERRGFDIRVCNVPWQFGVPVGIRMHTRSTDTCCSSEVWSSLFEKLIISVVKRVFCNSTVADSAYPNSISFLLEVTHTKSKSNECQTSFFTERIAYIWNSLPPSVVDFRSLSLFKRTIYNANLFT